MRERPWSRLQERLEASDVGRALISAFVIVTLVVIVAANLPLSELKLKLVRVAEPYIDAVGINQVWGVFAPDPRRQVVALLARIHYGDGSTGIWEPPAGWPFPDSYRDVRWRRWLDAAFREDFAEFTAAWIARVEADKGRDPVQVDLVKRSYLLFPPGTSPDHSPWMEDVYYRLEITPETLANKAG